VVEIIPSGVISKLILLYFASVSEDAMHRACTTHWAKKDAYRVLVGKPEGKAPLGRTKRRWKDMRMDLGETL
jgi:hypothetical protein